MTLPTMICSASGAVNSIDLAALIQVSPAGQNDSGATADRLVTPLFRLTGSPRSNALASALANTLAAIPP
jgi:hypothetical protein